MSTTLYFRNTQPDWSRGQGDNDLSGTSRNWKARALSAFPGSAAVSQNRATINGPVTGLEFDDPTPTPVEWISDPVNQDITISGSIVFNLWGNEANMGDNAGLGCIIERLSSQGAVISTIVDNPEIGTELPTTTPAVRNESSTPTSTSLLKGDRLRVRPYINDAAGVTMATAGTVTFRFDGPTAGSDGDSFVQFTEDFGFLVDAPGTGPSTDVDNVSGPVFGSNATQQVANIFTISSDFTATSINIRAGKSGTPTDNLVVAIQEDSSGSPSGTDLATASVAGSSLTTSLVNTTFNITDVALEAGKTYWLIYRRSGSLDDANNFFIGRSALQQPDMLTATYNGTTWTKAHTQGYSMAFTVTDNKRTTIYLTDTASAVDPNGSTHDAFEAWTTRGSGVLQPSTSSVAGPTAPLLATNGLGQNFLEWFTKQLQAFTLSGLVACNIRAQEAAIAANGAVRVEIAVCASDGTSPVVWGASNDGVELGTTEAAMVFNIAGDNTAVTDGQRLRIRVYWDDAPEVQTATGSNYTVFYAGTSAGASGDTYVVLPQAVTEFVAVTGIPDLVMARTRV